MCYRARFSNKVPLPEREREKGHTMWIVGAFLFLLMTLSNFTLSSDRIHSKKVSRTLSSITKGKLNHPHKSISKSPCGSLDTDALLGKTEWEKYTYRVLSRSHRPEKRRCLKKFFYAYRMYTTPLELMELVTEFHQTQQRAGWEKRIACFLSLWIDVERQELVADKLLRGAMKRLITHVVIDANKKEHLLHKLSTGHRINPLASMAVKPVPVNKQLLDWDSRKIARHLTMSEWGLFTKVRHTEFIGMAWQKPEKSVRAPYLTKLSERFNQVSFWVATSVITAESLKAQIAIVVKFINVLWSTLKINNLNTTLQILSGLNVTAVRRLKRVWEGVGPSAMAKFEEADDLFSPLSNFKAYRDHLNKLADSPLPILPYVGLFLKDVVYVFDGNALVTSSSAINHHRVSLFGDVIQKLQHYQKTPYQFEIDGSLEFYLHNVEGIMDDEDLYELSLRVQPIGTNQHQPIPSRVAEPVVKKYSSRASTLGRSTGRNHLRSTMAHSSEDVPSLIIRRQGKSIQVGATGGTPRSSRTRTRTRSDGPRAPSIGQRLKNYSPRSLLRSRRKDDSFSSGEEDDDSEGGAPVGPTASLPLIRSIDQFMKNRGIRSSH